MTLSGHIISHQRIGIPKTKAVGILLILQKYELMKTVTKTMKKYDKRMVQENVQDNACIFSG